MSTNLAAPQPKGLPGYYAGPPVESVGDMVRSLIRKGRTVAAGENLRWEENREFFRGNQWIRIANDQRGIQALARNLAVPSGRPGHNAYNRYRAMINSRVSLMTKERPPYEVAPEDNDQDSIDAARQAEKFIAARWGRTGWNIKHCVAELAKNGDIDGIAYLFVGWDPSLGDKKDQMAFVKMDGSPFESREEFEAAKAMDPNGEVLWRFGVSNKPLGDVSWRVVLPGYMSVDPFAVKSLDDAKWICETRILPRADIERRMGRPFKEAVAESKGIESDAVQYEDLEINDGGGGASKKMSEKDGVAVHYFYAVPQPTWPNGVFIEFLDKAPKKPLTVAEWKDQLPYFAYTPSPDPGHFIRSRGVGDDLKPIQRDYNQTLRDLRLWLNKTATAPVGLPRGSMISKSFYNEEGFYEYHPGLGEPRQTQVPSEPTAVFTNNLTWMAMEMERVSGVSSLAQGFSAPNSPESAVAISGQLQQTEQNLSETEYNLVDAIEWGCNRSMDEVRKNYTVGRTVTGVGVDDAEQFKAFEGSMLRGGRFRVTGPITPKSKAARMQSIFQLIPLIGEGVKPYLAQLIDGDPTELQQDFERAGRRQTREIRRLCTLATNETAIEVFNRFEEDVKAFSEAFNAAAAMASGMPPDPMTGQAMDPLTLLGQKGITPPMLTPMMNAAGIKLPMVNQKHDIHWAELKTANDWRMGEAAEAVHPMCSRLVEEHMDAHVEGLRVQAQSMAQQQPMGQQQGSQAAEKGTPSPPKNNPQTAGVR